LTTALADFTTRILATLNDPSAGRYIQAMTDEALKRALTEYSKANPLFGSQSITVLAAGREFAITSEPRFQNVYRVIHPYDSTKDYEPHLNSSGRMIYNAAIREDYYVYLKAGSPYIHLAGYDIPAIGDLIFVQYTIGHTIQNLDSAAATTVQLEHEPMIVMGAAAHAANMLANLQGTFPTMDKLKLWADTQEANYALWLSNLAKRSSRLAGPVASGYWKLDRWDGAGWRSKE
jgi:hypothetical protein